MAKRTFEYSVAATGVPLNWHTADQFVIELSAPLLVYVLALAPALLWGFGPILDKRAMFEGGSPLQATVVVLLVDASLFALALVALWVLRGNVPLVDLPIWVIGLFVLGGVFGTAIGRLATFAGVRLLGASVNTAAISARPLFATGFAIALLGESPTLLTLAGVVVLVAGLILLTVGKGGDVRGWDTKYLVYPLVAAAAFGIGNVIRRFALNETGATVLEALLINEVTALVILGGFALARRRGQLFRAPRRTYLLFSASGAVTALALFSLFAALAHPAGRVVIVDPLTATAPLFTTVFSYFLLRDLERVTPGIVGGAALVVVGAALITIS